MAEDNGQMESMESDVYVASPAENATPKKTVTKPKKKKPKQSSFIQKLPGMVRSLWATRQTEDIDKEKQMSKYVKITMRELAIYAVFLINLSLLALGMASSTVFSFSNIISSAFVSSTTAHPPFITFMDIYHMNDIWRFMQDIYPNNFYAGEEASYIATENRILGLSRLRQVRVKSDSCIVPEDFRAEIKYCYADWDSSTESKETYGPVVGKNATNDTAWVYRTKKELDGSTHQGLMNSYGGGGFAVELSSNKEETLIMLQDLFDNLWIDRGTRAVFFDLTIYNANINLFCQVRLVFELPATGGVVPSYLIRTVKLLRYVGLTDYIILCLEIVFVLFLCYYAVEEYLEIRKNGFKEYFKLGVWSFVDVLLIMIGIVCLVFNLFRQVKVSETLESLLQNDSDYFDFDFLCYWQGQFNNGVAFMTFLAWIKVFKYTSFNKTMSSLSMTLSRCAMDVAGFAVMFFIVFLAYAQLGYLVFGTQVKDFSTFERSIYTLFRIILGDFDFESLEKANRVLGPLFFLTYVFFVFFVLLNMFIAIINDTYAEIKAELANQKSDIELGSYLKKGYNKVLSKMNIRQNQILDIQKAITTADANGDKQIDYIEWRNNLRSKGYSDVEIETLFARYDEDGDRILNEKEQLAMMRDLADQNDQLREAMEAIEEACDDEEEEEDELAEEKRKRRAEGVMYEDCTFLANRIDTMEKSVGSIVGKIDSVLKKIDKDNKRPEGNSRPVSARIASGRSSRTSPNQSNC